MMPIRPEVEVFLHAAETLLSPILLGKTLNDDEKGMVVMYVQNLTEKYAMSVSVK